MKSHGSFRDKYALRVPLLSDPDLAVHKAFGAWGEKTMYGKKVEGTLRSTFVIGPDGRIAKVFPSVKVDGHVDQVLAVLGVASRGGGARRRPGEEGGAGEEGCPGEEAGRAAKKAAAKASEEAGARGAGQEAAAKKR